MTSLRTRLEQVLRKYGVKQLGCSSSHESGGACVSIIDDLLTACAPRPDREALERLIISLKARDMTAHELIGLMDKFMTWAGAGRPMWCSHWVWYPNSQGFGRADGEHQGREADEEMRVCYICATPRPSAG